MVVSNSKVAPSKRQDNGAWADGAETVLPRLEEGLTMTQRNKKLPPAPTEYKRSNRLFWGRSKVGRAVGTLWVVIPLIILIEIAMTLPLATVYPDHPMRMAYFCTACSLNGGDDIKTISDATRSCVVDNILLVIGEMFQGFIINYLATMIGHLMVTYALMASQDSTVSGLAGGRREVLHRVAYFLLMVDMIVEVVFLNRAEVADPESISLDGYTECGTEYEAEIVRLKEYLVNVAFWVLIIRTVFGGLIATVYVYKAQVEDFDVDSDSDGPDDEEPK